MKRAIAISAVAALLAACQSTPDAPSRATAALQPTKGNKTFGEASFEQAGDKVRVVVFAQGLRPEGEHGFHIHEAGDCSSGDGMSAKGHFNPFNKPHAAHTSAERHAGDLPSLKANQQGSANVQVDLDIITVASGPASVVGRRGHRHDDHE